MKIVRTKEVKICISTKLKINKIKTKRRKKREKKKTKLLIINRKRIYSTYVTKFKCLFLYISNMNLCFLYN